MRVAVIGVGRMGAAMAVRIAGAGHDVVLHNRTAERVRSVAEQLGAGAVVAPTPREAAADAEVCLVSLADDAAVLDVYGGPNGLASGVHANSVVCDSSTVAPATTRQVGGQVTGAGGSFLDTPVSGSVPLVEAGTLTVLVGGDEVALTRARPVLETFSARIFHLGEIGAGATMKLVVNSVVAALNVALAEALVLAERAGIDRERTYDVLEVSAAGAPYIAYKRAAFLDPEQAAVAFSLALVGKDQRLIDDLARDVAAPMALGEAGRRLVADAVAAGFGERDMSALAEYLRRSDR